MEIFQATMNELEELTVLFDEYRQFYGIESDVSSAKAFLQLRIALKESVIFIAVENGKAIGIAQLYPTFSSIALQRAYILNDIYVTEDARGLGVGRALMEKVFQYCEQQYARYVTLQTATDNVNARKLYEKLEMTQDQYSNYVKYFG
ncbi:GNAT family N-acetyltransferase [Lysinibacillus agricola]|uniref:GNAT family N-acetyltransferase n=1 Tax=Lysinibacillus agricola TaxID=2590012 RepID=A0ABX7AMG0_9BACI|nr:MULTISPECIES: GNAT family N-acetyltransferase [Lysinibacillus]KOS62177.1 acetyltransferase [Lysinibacillus sp. FJAT-14222]QQP11034.1 GNAT family N-acetyltransferase [Lysinibacillus agricola]